jgi:uncharacterized membrane protein
MTRKSRSLRAIGLLGLPLMYRGFSGHCPTYQALGISTAKEAERPQGRRAVARPVREVHSEESAIVKAAPAEVYRFCSRMENLPTFVDWLLHIEPIDERHTRWTAKSLLGTTTSWESELTDERENEVIAWRAIPGSEIDTSGALHFHPAADGQATEVRLSMRFNTAASGLGATLANALGKDLQGRLRHNLRQLKSLLEEQGAAASPTETASAAKHLAGGLEAQHRPL